ncbi:MULTISPECIES: nitroreductase family protein [Burkholderia]|uniref:nitroreductase family protein n=1 Tax=Burkholderia TaxID=32008 RepID=UPI00197BC336|nr:MULTISPECIES: nitroreductase family protein [Burkholderia]MBN3844443.1 nitroreductase family protein [Burkholderia sp. Ac-20349]MDN7875688.1 nitroreductase family protein [Burkholderia aenigmatica]
MTTNAISLYTKRRTQYALGKELPISTAEAEELIRQAIRIAPSAFNSQSSRAVILFDAMHEKLWDITRETLRAIVPADAFAPTDAKMDAFAAGAGTVLFFEDQDVIQELQKQFPLYADAFPMFSEHSAGMAQFAVWTALAEAGIGASLQHYNPLVEAEVTKQWNVPASWKLRAQMPFGSNLQPFPEKTFIADELRFKTFR